VAQFIAEHEKVFVVEQNRDAQMRSMLINELDVDPARLIRVLHYDGTPITARFIGSAIRKNVETATSLAPAAGRKELV
jgi:2-oxoglutarate ferredoxin oxidoreductase subunit alpha